MVLSSISCFIFGLPFWLIKLINVVIIILYLAGLACYIISLLKDPDLGSYKYHRK
jgi:phage shock protein PspC (stress-responsive transcriptional regulator)